MGRAYGGSTAVYTGVTFKIAEKTVAKWNVPDLAYEDLNGRMGKYLGENNVHLLEPEKINENNLLFRDACKKLDYHVAQFPINVKGCKGSSLCNLGCPNNAKQGTAQVQLPMAEQGGVEVITNCRVESIDGRKLTAVVNNTDFGEASSWSPGRHEIVAKVIVLAAGAIQTSALLLRSGLGERLPALGRYFTAHPALVSVAQHSHKISNFHGFPKSYYSEQFVDSSRFLLETCMYFPFVTAKNLAGFGAEHGAMMAHFDRLQMILTLALDPAEPENRIALDQDGEPVVHYTLNEEVLNAFVDSGRAAARIFFASGAERAHVQASENFLIEKSQSAELDRLVSREHLKLGKTLPAAAHLMGGCRMGEDKSSSVTDAWGRVHGEKGIYVGDASLFPACSEVNPYLTIMGLADRVAEAIKNDLPEIIGGDYGQ